MTSHSPVVSLGPSTITETSSGENRPKAGSSGELWGQGVGVVILLSLPVLATGTSPWSPRSLPPPTLLLWGEKDTYFEQGLVGAISSRFVPGRLEAHILPGVGHWIPQSNPGEMHEYMWAFLQDLLD